MSQVTPSKRSFILACSNSIHSCLQFIPYSFAYYSSSNSTFPPAQNPSVALGYIHNNICKPWPESHDAYDFTKYERSNLFTKSPQPISHFFWPPHFCLSKLNKQGYFDLFFSSTSLHKLYLPFKI